MAMRFGKNAFSLRLLPILMKKFLWTIYLLYFIFQPKELIENIVYLFKGVHKYEMEKPGIFEEFVK